MNAVDLALTGFAVVFDQRGVDGRAPDRLEDFKWAPELFGTLPCRIDHLPIVSSDGIHLDIGRATQFAIVNGPPPIPYGVLAFIELDDSPMGLSVLAAVARQQLHSLSLGDHEVSLTDHPAYLNCKIVGWGEHARRSWDVLTALSSITDPTQDS